MPKNLGAARRALLPGILTVCLALCLTITVGAKPREETSKLTQPDAVPISSPGKSGHSDPESVAG